jgi:D-3-phosphoglycerate dehydrogenase
MTARVVVIAPGYRDYAEENAALAGIATVEELEWHGDPQRLAAGLGTADIVLVRDTRISADLIAAMERVRGILRYGVGYDTVDTEAARARRIYVTNVPDYGAAIDVSDHAAALLLDLCRRVTRRDRAVRSGRWNIAQAEPIHRIAGSTLGLVGYGRIARELHRKMLAFGIAKVLVSDPFLPSAEIAERGAEPVELADLLSRSDLISLHAPGRPDGSPIIDASLLRVVKRGAYLVNTARGTLIDEQALVEALADGRLGGAGLDVMREEPPPPDSPLRSAPNLVLTDHVAWYSESSVRELQRQVGQQARAILDGKVPPHWVNPW